MEIGGPGDGGHSQRNSYQVTILPLGGGLAKCRGMSQLNPPSSFYSRLSFLYVSDNMFNYVF